MDITPTSKKLPDQWQKHVLTFPTEDQYSSFVNELSIKEVNYRLRSKLNPDCIYSTIWNNQELKDIFLKTYSLRGVLFNHPELTPTWLTYWELFNTKLIKFLINKIQIRNANSTKLAGKPTFQLKVMFIENNMNIISGTALTVFQKIISKIELETKTRVDFDYLSTSVDTLNGSKKIISSDLSRDFTPANMRMWKNKIDMTIKVVDIIVCNSYKDDYEINGILFCLLNLRATGSAFVKLPRITSGAAISAVHLFSLLFEYTEITQIQSTDDVYLCGYDFLAIMNPKHKQILEQYIASNPNLSNKTLFSLDYLNSDNFLFTLNKIIAVNNNMQSNRMEFYSKLLDIYDTQLKSRSADLIEDFLDTQINHKYKDRSDEWIKKHNFDFFPLNN